MNLFQTTVVAGTTTAGGLLGKTIGAKVLGSVALGVIPLAAVGAYAGFKLVHIGLNASAKEKSTPEAPPSAARG